MSSTKKTTLTDKQRAFVESYLQTWNATESARRAGYKGSDGTLRSIGSENLTKPDIREVIDARLREHRITSDEIVGRLHAIASAEDEPTKNVLRALEILARHLMPTKSDVDVTTRGEIVVDLVPVEQDPNRPGQLRVVEKARG